ncbi:hypothetical protein ACJZ2D_005754 [Fusarium nematophilum]
MGSKRVQLQEGYSTLEDGFSGHWGWGKAAEEGGLTLSVVGWNHTQAGKSGTVKCGVWGRRLPVSGRKELVIHYLVISPPGQERIKEAKDLATWRILRSQVLYY